MHNKVTSFETSKKLSELGFESESHCGWWTFSKFSAGQYKKNQIIYSNHYMFDPGADCHRMAGNTNYKAYDCNDLLIALSKRTYFYPEPHKGRCFQLNIKWDKTFSITPSNNRIFQTEDINSIDEQPQEALAQAVIKILEEKDDE